MRGKTFSLPIENFSIEPFEDSRFLKMKLYVMHDQTNPNKSTFALETIDSAKDSIVNIPILAYVNEDEDDFGEHEMEYEPIYDEDGNLIDEKITYIEKPIGVIPATNNNYHYEEIDGLNYVVVYGYIWTTYAEDAVKIIERDNNVKLSMEIIIDKGKYDKFSKVYTVEKYRYTGITLLGQKYGTGMKNAHANVANYSKNQIFSENLEELNKVLFSLNADTNSSEGGDQMNKEHFLKKDDFGTGDKLEIDLSKDAADTSTTWGDVDKTKLRNDILKASNYKTAVSKCYLIVEDGWKDSPSSKLKYPVCMIKNNKLILSSNGCEAALQRLHQEDIESGSAINKLKKYYKELDLSTDNFSIVDSNKREGEKMTKKEFAAQFSLSQEQLEDQLRCELAELGTFELWEDYEVARFCFVDYYVETKTVIAYDRQECRLVGFNYDVLGDNVEVNGESGSPYKITYEPLVVASDPDNDDDGNVNLDEDDNGMAMGMMGEFVQEIANKVKEKMATMEAEFTTEKESFTKEKENFTSELSAKDAIISEKEDAILAMNDKFQAIEQESQAKDVAIETLSQFKKKHEEAERKEKVEALFAKFSKHLSKEEMEDFRNRESEFASYELFEKEIKSFTCDRLVESMKEPKPQFSNMAIVDNNDDEPKTEQPKDVWSRLSK